MKYYKKSIADNKDVEFVHISQDASRGDAQNWAKSVGFPWLTVLSSKARSTGLMSYFSGGVPSYVLIDKDGKALAKGKQASVAKIKELTGK